MQQLVFDIGMHKGEDALHYLKNGYKVLSVEANPTLVELVSKKLKKYIDTGQLTILNMGIADGPRTLTFYVNDRLTEWSSFDKESGTRLNTPYHTVDVQCNTLQSIIAKYGVPHYLKTDIEGFDLHCIKDLPDHSQGPRFVSTEASDYLLIDILYEKGYRQFKLINQFDNFNPISFKKERSALYQKWRHLSSGIKLRLQKIIPFKYAYGSSGPFGNDSKGQWTSYDEVKDAFTRFYLHNEKSKNNTSWFDIHATY